MSVQFIETDDGKRLAVLPEADYRALIEAKEENRRSCGRPRVRRRARAR